MRWGIAIAAVVETVHIAIALIVAKLMHQRKRCELYVHTVLFAQCQQQSICLYFQLQFSNFSTCFSDYLPQMHGVT